MLRVMLPSEALRRRRIERLAAEISQREGAALEKARVIAAKRDAYWHRNDVPYESVLTFRCNERGEVSPY